MFRAAVLAIFLLVVFGCRSQQLHNQSWYSAASQVRITNHSGIWVDGNMKLDGRFYERSWSSLMRAAYIYYVTDDTRIMAGYAHIVTYGKPNIPEERLWEQLYWTRRTPLFRIAQYVRLEERFKQIVKDDALTDHYGYKTGMRYNLLFTSKVLGQSKQGLFVYMGNELFLNVYNKISGDLFDQDRIGAGLGYRFSEQLNAQAGYLYSHQRLTDNKGTININVLRLAFYHTLDVRRKA